MIWRRLRWRTAGRIWSLSVHDNRLPEAAALASELEKVIDVDCDPATKSIILIALAYARFANCEFEPRYR